MTEAPQPFPTSFQQANGLLRTMQWEEALSAYSKLWTYSPQLQSLLAWNMNYLLRKAPVDALGAGVRGSAIRLLQEAGAWSTQSVLGFEGHSKKLDAATILDRHVSQGIADKTLPRKPDERVVLYLASEMVKQVGHEAAYLYAERHMPEKLRYTTHVLQANASLCRGDESAWLFHLNRYLQRFEAEPLVLREGSTLLSRLSTKSLPSVTRGPLVTVIMPAWNAQDTVEFAARSILNQTWRPIELIIIDDASTDGTWSVLQRIAKSDSRVRIFRNIVNVGPYVSKNIALKNAKGDFVTGHDSDDWAHPQRLERQVSFLLESNGKIRASLSYMLRMTLEGRLGFITKLNSFTLDGVARKALISSIFYRHDLVDLIGYWDTVRFAADSEMVARASLALKGGFVEIEHISMLCLDHEGGLTNHPVHGIRGANGKLSESRSMYRDAWTQWHSQNPSAQSLFLPFPQESRRYVAYRDMAVPYEHQLTNLTVLDQKNGVGS